MTPKFRIFGPARWAIYGSFCAAATAALVAAMWARDSVGIVVAWLVWLAFIGISARLWFSRAEIRDRIKWVTPDGVQLAPHVDLLSRWSDTVAMRIEHSTRAAMAHWEAIYPGVKGAVHSVTDGVMVWVEPRSIKRNGQLYHGLQYGSRLIVEWLPHQDAATLSAIVTHELEHLILDLAGVPQGEHHDTMQRLGRGSG